MRTSRYRPSLDGQVIQEAGRRVVELRVGKTDALDGGEDGGPVVRGGLRACGTAGVHRFLGRGRPPRDGHVGTPRQLDPEEIPGPREQVVPLERTPQAARLDPHDRVHRGVEVRPAVEDSPGDRRLGQALLPPGESLLDDVAEERPGAGRGIEVRAGEDPLQFLQDLAHLGDGDGGFLLLRLHGQASSHGWLAGPVPRGLRMGLA